MDINHHLLPEWAVQSGIIISWPHDKSHWGDQFQKLEETFILLVKIICRFENLHVICFDHDHELHITNILSQIDLDLSNICFHQIKTNDIWTRDYGPISLHENNKLILLNYQFDGWGKKYPHELDNQFTHQLYQKYSFGDSELRDLDFILEGGSIDFDGAGTLLTTRKCLVGSKRNPAYSPTDIEQFLIQSLGVNRIIYLNHGFLMGDDTDGHIDMLARFCNQRTIAYTACDNTSDAHYKELLAMAEELSMLKTLDNKPYNLIPLPIPEAKFNHNGERLPASYCNFLIINKAVLVPTYEDKHDDLAMTSLQQGFPDREIIGINSLPLISQFGSLHCATMQLALNID